jgi:hypothetical protein
MKRSSKSSVRRIAVGLLLLAALPSGAEAAGRKFYLTQDTFFGNQALTACAKGYHMASLWEIFNLSTLTYDTKRGQATQDSGNGPPPIAGWIRTGFLDSGAATPGEGNCHTWTSASPSDEGTLVNLPGAWQSGSTIVSPWQATGAICSNRLHVWCVAGR